MMGARHRRERNWMAKKKRVQQKKRTPVKKRTPKKKAPKKKAPAKKRAKKKTPRKRSAPEAHRVDRLEIAKLLGVHPDTISDYTRNGMPVITRGGAGRKSVYDAVECLAWWRAQYRQDKKDAAQTRAYGAQAELNELKIATQKSELIPLDDVILAGQNYTKAWTAKIRALPRQMVQAGLIPREREAGVTAMLHALLLEISRWETLPRGAVD